MITLNQGKKGGGGAVLEIRSRFVRREFTATEEVYDFDFRIGSRDWVTIAKWMIRRMGKGRYVVTFIPSAQMVARGYVLEAIHWDDEKYQEFLDYVEATKGINA